jgi:hypothetical protein
VLWHTLSYSNKFTFVAVCVIISALIIDTSIIKVYYFNVIDSSNRSPVIVFIIISSISIIGQYLVLEYVKKKSREIRINTKLHLEVLHKAVTIVQYGLTAINIIVIVQLTAMSSYSITFLIIVSGISYGLCTALMGILALRFISWFRSNRNYVVLSYGLSSGIIALNAAFTVLFMVYLFLNEPALVRPHPGFTTPFLVSTPITVTLTFGYIASSIASFAVSWAATAILLHHYSKKLEEVKYWLVVSIPLIYFLIQFQPLFLNLLLGLGHIDPTIFSVLYTLIFTMSKPTGGVLFGVAFWVITRRLPRGLVVREYMIISAFGFVLLFVSNQGIVLVSAPYPPFGLPTISFIGLASYMILAGIYSSAASVSQDSKLRQTIRSFAIRESRLLDSIGMAQMEQEIQKRVIAITKQNQDRMTADSGIESSLTEEDMKQYLGDVLEEVKNMRSKGG